MAYCIIDERTYIFYLTNKTHTNILFLLLLMPCMTLVHRVVLRKEGYPHNARPAESDWKEYPCKAYNYKYQYKRIHFKEEDIEQIEKCYKARLQAI